MYNTVMNMTKSAGLKNRLIGCAAQEGRADAQLWVEQNIFRLVKGSDWVSAWEYAEDTKTVNVNPDTGARDDVINDGMILAAVQSVIAEDTPEA
jgi:hypothetical protein